MNLHDGDVTRLQKMFALAAAVAAPAAVYGMLPASGAGAGTPLCFASGSVSYRFATPGTAADVRVRVSSDPARADLKMRLVDTAAAADFVLVDDFGGATSACRSPAPIQTVALAGMASGPADVTVDLSAGAEDADYTIYVRSTRYSQADAAALLAAMWQADRRGETTGSIRRR